MGKGNARAVRDVTGLMVEDLVARVKERPDARSMASDTPTVTMISSSGRYATPVMGPHVAWRSPAAAR